MTQTTVKLLPGGLKFNPSSRNIELRADFDAVKRRIRLKWCFKDNGANKDVNDPETFYTNLVAIHPGLMLFSKTSFLVSKK